MPLDEYLVGVAFLVLTAGAVLGAAALVVRRRLTDLDGAAAALAFAILLTGGLLGVHLLPGLAGVLSRESALLAALALLASVAIALRPRRGEGPRPAPALAWRDPPPATSRLSLAIAALAAVAVVLWSASAAWLGTLVPSTDIDTLTFHLPNVAKWIQTGTVWRTDQFVPLLANGNYPQNGDVVMLTAILPFDSDAFVRAVGLPFAGIAGLSVYALAMEAGARRGPAVLFAAAYSALPVFVLAAYEGAKTDVIMLAMFGAGMYFLLRSWRDPRRSTFLLAGLALGIAFGTKWYGVWSVGVAILVWAVGWLSLRSPRRQLAVAGGWVMAAVAGAGGVWLLRNAIESGSPLYPSPVRLFGLTVFDAPRDPPRECGGFTVAGYWNDPGVWRELILPAYRAGYGGPGLALVVGWALALGLLVRRFASPRDGRVAPAAALAAAVPLLVLAYAVTPYSAIGPAGEPFVQANLRWLLPAFMLAAPVAAWAVSQLRSRAALVCEAATLVALLATLRDGIDPPASVVRTASLSLVAAVVLALAAAYAWRSRSGPLRSLAAALGAVLAAGAVALGQSHQKAFHDGRYAEDPVTAVLAAPATDAERAGLAGVWSTDGPSPILPAFGPRLRRDVSFVGYMVDGQLREYETRAQFLAAVERGGFDLLVVGRGVAAYGGCAVPGIESDEDLWAREEGFRLVAQTDRLSLYAPG